MALDDSGATLATVVVVVMMMLAHDLVVVVMAVAVALAMNRHVGAGALSISFWYDSDAVHITCEVVHGNGADERTCAGGQADVR